MSWLFVNNRVGITLIMFRYVTKRLTFGLIFLFCAASLMYALYSPYFEYAEPCPLCIAQRVIYAVIMLISFVALITNCKNWGNYIYAGLLFVVSVFGIKTAAHHVWLQNLPIDQWPQSCGMPLEVLYHRIPLSGFLETILSGTAECAAINWTVFGVSGPLVSMFGYILCVISACYILINQFIKSNN